MIDGCYVGFDTSRHIVMKYLGVSHVSVPLVQYVVRAVVSPAKRQLPHPKWGWFLQNRRSDWPHRTITGDE